MKKRKTRMKKRTKRSRKKKIMMRMKRKRRDLLQPVVSYSHFPLLIMLTYNHLENPLHLALLIISIYVYMKQTPNYIADFSLSLVLSSLSQGRCCMQCWMLQRTVLQTFTQRASLGPLLVFSLLLRTTKTAKMVRAFKPTAASALLTCAFSCAA
jgi:hypothetical protein